MVHNKNEWLGYLNLYGCDFSRWPRIPSEKEKDVIKNTLEYKHAEQIDLELDQVEWPYVTHNLRNKILGKVQSLNNSEIFPAPTSQPLFLFIRRPVFLASCFMLFLFLGLTTGIQYNNAEIRNKMDYSYFSLGSAYAYGATKEVMHVR